MLGLFFLGGIFMKIILGERCSEKTTNQKYIREEYVSFYERR